MICRKMRHSVPVPSGTGTVLTFQIMAMWTKIKTIALYALIGICCCSMIFSLIGNRKSGDVIKVSFWGTNLPYQYALEEIARRYNEFQSDYEVVVSKEDAGNYRTWMSAQLAGGNASDLLMTTPVYADADASNGYLYDLTDALNQPNPYNDEDELWKDSFAGSYLTQVQDKNNPGQWNCVPTSTVSVRIVINKEMLEARNIEIPDENWTFSDFRRICEVFEAEGITALEIANGELISYMVSWMTDIFLAQVMYEDILTWDFNQNGQIDTEEIVRIFMDDEIALDLTNNEKFSSVLRFLKAWSKYWGEGFNSRKDSSENFLRQSVPMFFAGSWAVAGIELTLGNENPDADQTNPYEMFDYVSLPFPRLERVNYISETESFEFPTLTEGLPLQELGEPSNCYCIPISTVQAGKLDGVLDFLYYFTSREGAGIVAEMAYDIPVITGVEIDEIMNDFLPPENGESVRMRFGLQNLADGTAEEYHFKQMQLFLMDTGGISLETFTGNIQNKYLEVTELLAEDNEWSW